MTDPNSRMEYLAGCGGDEPITLEHYARYLELVQADREARLKRARAAYEAAHEVVLACEENLRAANEHFEQTGATYWQLVQLVESADEPN